MEWNKSILPPLSLALAWITSLNWKTGYNASFFSENQSKSPPSVVWLAVSSDVASLTRWRADYAWWDPHVSANSPFLLLPPSLSPFSLSHGLSLHLGQSNGGSGGRRCRSTSRHRTKVARARRTWRRGERDRVIPVTAGATREEEKETEEKGRERVIPITAGAAVLEIPRRAVSRHHRRPPPVTVPCSFAVPGRRRKEDRGERGQREPSVTVSCAALERCDATAGFFLRCYWGWRKPLSR